MNDYKLVDRMKETSTFEGLLALGALIGYNVTVDEINWVGSIFIGIYGLVKMFKKEKK